jgi:beta-lactamase class A
MCSTFKWVLAAAVLAQTERSLLSLDEQVPYQQADLLQYAPVTSKHLADGMTVGELTRTAVVVSDNTAANLLLSRLSGPSAITGFARSCGDAITRLDRNEPLLNSNEAGDIRDTTSPRAMATLMRTVLCGNVLSSQSRDLLLQWLRDCETGHDLLRAGLPGNWVVGDKTGSGQNGAINDVAIATAPGRSPLLVTAFLSEGKADTPVLRAAHADIGKLVAHHFT